MKQQKPERLHDSLRITQWAEWGKEQLDPNPTALKSLVPSSLLNSLPAKTLQLSLCLFILTKSLGEKMETLSRHVGESELPAGVLHSWSRSQQFSRTSNKKRKVPRTQCINQLHHPSQTEQHRMPGRGTKEKVPPGPWGCPQIWGRRLGARTAFPLLPVLH